MLYENVGESGCGGALSFDGERDEGDDLYKQARREPGCVCTCPLCSCRIHGKVSGMLIPMDRGY